MPQSRGFLHGLASGLQNLGPNLAQGIQQRRQRQKEEEARRRQGILQVLQLAQGFEPESDARAQALAGIAPGDAGVYSGVLQGLGQQQLSPETVLSRQEAQYDFDRKKLEGEREGQEFGQAQDDAVADALSQLGTEGINARRREFDDKYRSVVVDRAFNMAQQVEDEAARKERETAAVEGRLGVAQTQAETASTRAGTDKLRAETAADAESRKAGQATYRTGPSGLVRIDPDGKMTVIDPKKMPRTEATKQLQMINDYIDDPQTIRDGQEELYPDQAARDTEQARRRAEMASEVERMREIIGAQDVPEEEETTIQEDLEALKGL